MAETGHATAAAAPALSDWVAGALSEVLVPVASAFPSSSEEPLLPEVVVEVADVVPCDPSPVAVAEAGADTAESLPKASVSASFVSLSD